MHIHILGIGGTFMSALAILARQVGFKVTGSDAHCYPPISDLLAQEQITWTEGYEDATQMLQADCVVVGNAMKRGLSIVEAMLEQRKPYTSGPDFLREHILSRYKVIAVAGTHGKTTTTSMLAFILDYAGLNPGFLIGGVSSDFKTNARLGKGDFFVIESDEYDSAFFDKRPKFMHYRPEIAILNNLEFDHADIYDNLPAIQQQFHYFIRTIPPSGTLIKPRDDKALNEVLTKGVYSKVEDLALIGPAFWRAEILEENASKFKVFCEEQEVATVEWALMGQINVENALAALAASTHAGVKPTVAAEALGHFTPVKRRLEVKSESNGVTVYDDFAHHPTAIKRTLDALIKSARHQRILVVLEFASYTMKSGVHKNTMKDALIGADDVFVLNPSGFNLHEMATEWAFSHAILPDTAAIVRSVAEAVKPGDAVLVMSNRGFDGIHQKLAEAITSERYSTSL